MSMIVQIYEIQIPQEAHRCIELGVDHVGSVILANADWRQTNLKEVIALSQGTSTKNSIIPLFNDIETLSKVLDYYRPDFIHLCDALIESQGKGREVDRAVELQVKLKERFPDVGIIRTLPVPARRSAKPIPLGELAKRFEPISDFFLTDTWVQEAPVKGFLGITGEPCDLDVARNLVCRSSIPVILAGGLSPDNVYEALSKVTPAGADSCTHTNMRGREGKVIRFRKDFARVRRFVEEVRRAERDLVPKTGKAQEKEETSTQD
jgi:phosphoribosylanthranilate isomerase